MNLMRIPILTQDRSSRATISVAIALFLSLALLLCAPFSSAYSQNRRGVVDCPPVRNIPESELAFKAGEYLKYVAKYKWGSINSEIGEAEVSLALGGSTPQPWFHAKVVGKTYKFYDIFFKVRDYYESKFYVSNTRPFYFHRDISEGKYKMKNTYNFLPNNNIVAKIERINREVRDTVLKGKPCTFDLLTLFYFARNLEFGDDIIGKEMPISFAIDDEIYNLYYRFLGREVKKVYGSGVYRTLKFAARVVAGEVFTGEEEMLIWVSDDKNKVPVYFESPIIVGTVSGSLTKFSGLKYPMSSKIK